MTATDIINRVCFDIDARRYLEIGVLDPSRNFDLIECEDKTGVSLLPQGNGRPDIYHCSSDEFFDGLSENNRWDTVFLSGFRTNRQSFLDVINATWHLSPDGVIVLNDCLPQSVDTVTPVKPPGDNTRNGEVWLTWLWMRKASNFLTAAIDCDQGVGLARLGRNMAILPRQDLTCCNAREWAGIVSVEKFSLLGVGVLGIDRKNARPHAEATEGRR